MRKSFITFISFFLVYYAVALIGSVIIRGEVSQYFLIRQGFVAFISAIPFALTFPALLDAVLKRIKKEKA